MYAIIRTGGKQYLVGVGDVVDVETLPLETGEEVSFEEILMVNTDETVEVGRPVLANARVVGEVLDQVRGKKIRIFKHKRRKDYRKGMGHRQNLTRVRIKEISLN